MIDEDGGKKKNVLGTDADATTKMLTFIQWSRTSALTLEPLFKRGRQSLVNWMPSPLTVSAFGNVPPSGGVLTQMTYSTKHWKEVGL